MIKQIILILIGLIFILNCKSQKLLELTHKEDSTKIEIIEKNQEFHIDLYDNLNADEIEKVTTYYGKLDSVTNTSIMLKLNSYSQHITFKDNSESLFDMYYSCADQPTITEIQIDAIDDFNLYNDKGAFGVGIFATTASLSFISTLIAPAFCIDYKNWEFNDDRYFKILSYSLSTLGISIGCMITISASYKNNISINFSDYNIKLIN